MKKNFKFLLVALLAFVGFNSAMAEIAADSQISDDNFYYTVKTLSGQKGTVYITKINAEQKGAITLPAEIKKTDEGREYTFTVTGIADASSASGAAFFNQVNLTSVKVPSSIEYIGKNAFYGCTNLAKIDLTEATGLKEIADQAFVTIQVTEYDFSAATKLTGLTGTPFVETDKEANSYIEKITLPTSNKFTEIGTALANLPKLATLNIADTKIDKIEANAFKGDVLLTAMVLPATVETIAAKAFEGSKVATLTINADEIKEIGDGSVAVYGSDAGEVLTSLTIQHPLKGVIKTNAFAGEAKLETLNITSTFGTKAQIATEAFKGIDKITKITLGDITDNDDTKYTIDEKAFSGELLTEVEIGNITATKAINTSAFGETSDATLTKVTIGNIYSSDLAIAANAFELAAEAATEVTIGNVRSTNANAPVLAAAAFNFNATDAEEYPATITIGAVEAKAKNFTAAAFTGTVITSVTFNGDIEAGAIDVAILSSVNALKTLTFNGVVGTEGIGENAFAGLIEGAVVNFNNDLKKGALAEGSFTTSNKITVNYTPKSAEVSEKAIDQKAFAVEQLSADADRYVTLNIIGNDGLKAEIAALQISIDDTPEGLDADDDVIYAVKLIDPAKDEALTLKVYLQTGTTTSYGRWYLTSADYPDGIKIARRGNDGVKTLTLYTTYVEDDEDNEVVNINMQPIVSTDGYYYLTTSALGDGLVVIAKATGTSADETEIEYEGTTEDSSVLYTDNEVKVSEVEVTNQQLRDGTGSVTVGDDEDLYFITNPANHKGVTAPTYDFRTANNIHIAVGSFYLVASHYAGSSSARIVWLDGDDDATAIENVKTVASEAGVVYNLAGQKVDANYKGIVIKNGQKLIQK